MGKGIDPPPTLWNGDLRNSFTIYISPFTIHPYNANLYKILNNVDSFPQAVQAVRFYIQAVPHLNQAALGNYYEFLNLVEDLI